MQDQVIDQQFPDESVGMDDLTPQERVQQGTVGQVLNRGFVVPPERASERILDTGVALPLAAENCQSCC